MSFQIRYHPKAWEEVDSLEGGQKKKVYKQILKLSITPELGKPLRALQGNDLSDCRTMYADDKRIRIVYRLVEGTPDVFIIAIGKRDDFNVYKKAVKRL